MSKAYEQSNQNLKMYGKLLDKEIKQRALPGEIQVKTGAGAPPVAALGIIGQVASR